MMNLNEQDEPETHTAVAGRLHTFVIWFFGWLLVRPRRWLFRKMICATSPHWKIEKHEYFGWIFPNIHWWLLYITVFMFFKWLNYDAWRLFCDWTGGRRMSYPLTARVIHRIGKTTAGYVISGGECFHCARVNGDPVDLSGDETGSTFVLEGTSSYGTQNGTDHRFWGKTICPNCGYIQNYEDGSL